MRSGGGEVAQRGKGSGSVAQGVLSGLQDEERLPPGHPGQAGSVAGSPNPRQPRTPACGAQAQEKPWAARGAGDCSISDRLPWHEMKGLEWGCWQTDRRGGWRPGVGAGEITICEGCQV